MSSIFWYFLVFHWRYLPIIYITTPNSRYWNWSLLFLGDKMKGFVEKGCLNEQQQGQGTHENCSMYLLLKNHLGLVWIFLLKGCFFFFWCGSFLKSLLNLLWYCFCFMFWFFWPWSMWGFSSLPRDWTYTPCIGRQSLFFFTFCFVSGYSWLTMLW